MNYKVAGANPGAGWLAGWKLPCSWVRELCVVLQMLSSGLSVSETAGFCLKVHVALAVVTVSLAYVTFIYPFQVLCNSFSCASLPWTE